MEYIQLKKDDILRVGIKDAQGNDTGEHLEFDLEDIELPIRIEEAMQQHHRNIDALQKKIYILEKNNKGNTKDLDIEKLKLAKETFKKEEKALDLFLGKGGTKKILNGRNHYYRMFDDIMDVLEPIFPLIEKRATEIQEQIKNKYSFNEDKGIIE